MRNDSRPNAAPNVHGNEMEMMHPQPTRELAQRLIAYEGAACNAESLELAAFRVCGKLRQPVCTLTGADGFRPLVSRALALARVEAPILSTLQVAADGSLQGLDELGRQTAKDQVREGGAILLTQLIGLLLAFIGEAMTSRLVISEALPPYRSIPENGVRTGFEVILNEVDQLQGVSARLEALAEQHKPFTEALMTVAGNIRSTATVLGVLVAVRSPKPN